MPPASPPEGTIDLTDLSIEQALIIHRLIGPQPSSGVLRDEEFDIYGLFNAVTDALDAAKVDPYKDERAKAIARELKLKVG